MSNIYATPPIRPSKPKAKEGGRFPARRASQRDSAMEAYSKITEAALAGDRAPASPQLFGGTGAISRLLKMGKIRIEIYGHNWRVIELLDGPNRGARTAEDPKGGKPYSVR